MVKRTITSIIMGVILIPLVIIGKVPYLILGMILSVVAGYELLKAFEKEVSIFKILKYCYPLLNIITLLLIVYASDWILFWLGIVLVMTLISYVLSSKITFKAVLIMLFVKVYSGLCLGLVLSIRNYDLIYLGWLLVMVFLTDIGAYLVGSQIGKHKLCPVISPNKSVEGFIGGNIFSLIGGITYYLFLVRPLNLIKVGNNLLEIIIAIVLILIISIGSQIGDLIASKIKRVVNIKDYGTIFPGHGGVMDRFDSVLFSGIILVLIFKVLLR